MYHLIYYIMMKQINFRVKENEKKLVEELARLKGISVAEFAKQSLLKEIEPIREDFAFSLLKQGKIGFKRAWIISGLSYHEFLVQWNKKKAEEHISDASEERSLKLALSIDLKKFLK